MKSTITRFTLVVTVVLVGSVASAQELPTLGHADHSGGFVYGVGALQCSVFNQFPTKHNLDLMSTWIEGYVTAAEAQLSAWANRTLIGDDEVRWPVVESDALHNWARTYCQQHPDEMLNNVADKLFAELVHKVQFLPKPVATGPKQ
jgi:hypothetical protein